MKAFDNLYQRHFEYSYSDDVEVQYPAGDMVTRRYKEKLTTGPNGDSLTKTPVATLSFGPAFNIDLVASKQGCFGCNMDLLNKITVDSKPFKDGVPQNDLFETMIEPTSGFMIQQEKALTVYINL